mmetsp:Transcript_111791/g.355567  ORF Transcript_111791/g.355567 Transcript_111791/m.355567 type:complete len:718 (-) Transcript_111791:500-2653(-)
MRRAQVIDVSLPAPSLPRRRPVTMADATKVSIAIAGLKRKGLADLDGKDSYAKVNEKKVKATDSVGKAKQKVVNELASAYAREYVKQVAPEDKPFLGAQPLLLRKPCISTVGETERVTAVACKTIGRLIKEARGVHIRISEDARRSDVARGLMEAASDEVVDIDEAPVVVSMTRDLWHTLPFTQLPSPPGTAKRLLIYVGTPGKYLSMCIKSYRGRFDTAYEEDRLVILCKGVCMLPLGTQEQNIFGVDEVAVLKTIGAAVRARGSLAWGHGVGTKASIMTKLYGYPVGGELPKPLCYEGDAGGSANSFDYLVDYVRFLNQLKIAKPEMPVTVWYDTGLLVSVLMGSVVGAGVSLLTDSDGVSMLRDASIGHIISKLNQVIAVEPFKSAHAVYNFFIGDGACRLNGGVELALHLMEGHKAQSLTNLFIFNNHKWAIEDNLVAGTEKEHVLHNKDFYDLVQNHDQVCVCENELELRETLALLSRRTDAYLQGKGSPGLSIVVVRGMDIELPPVIGDIGPIRKSVEMKFMRDVLGKFSAGCQHKIPLYGCSAFEYIQYLHIFMEEMPEGQNYQYVCGRTDIQAAHMCGLVQPEGRAVLFINDIYGINSLGESLRFVLSGFGGRQLLIMIWHPSLLNLIDHFHLHRPPMVWPSIGPELCKYYVRKESDALFVDFAGASGASRITEQVTSALAAGTPLVVCNILPEQERDYVSLDIRVKTG